MLCPWESPSEATCWDAPADPSLWSSFITPYSAFPFLCLPSAHPFTFSSLSPPSSLCPFRLFRFHFCITFFFLPVPLFLFPLFFSHFPSHCPLLGFAHQTLSCSTLRISLLFYKLWIIQGHISTRLIKTQCGREPQREGNREGDVFSFPWLKQLFHG